MNGHIVVFHQDGAIRDFDFLIERMRENRTVSSAAVSIAPIVEGQVMASFGGRNAGAMIRGIRMTDFIEKADRGTRVHGKAPSDIIDGELLVGTSLARNLRASLNDRVNLISATGGTATAFGMMPRMMSYPIASTFFMGMYEYDSAFIFMTLETAQKYLNIDGAVTHIDLYLSDARDTDRVRRALWDTLPQGFIIRDWRELNQGFVGALQVEANVMFLILMMIVIVAVFNIVSSLFMLVKDKSRDIAIFRTFGVSRKSMMKIFILAGTSIGVIGSLFGMLFGILIATYIEPIRQVIQSLTGRDLFPPELYLLSELPSEINPVSVAGIVITAIVLSFLATLYPAWKASKTDPVEVLRYE
jgi:lipoprotein-releasing system permease protein